MDEKPRMEKAAKTDMPSKRFKKWEKKPGKAMGIITLEKLPTKNLDPK
jgi:hypothetical protein